MLYILHLIHSECLVKIKKSLDKELSNSVELCPIFQISFSNFAINRGRTSAAKM